MLVDGPGGDLPGGWEICGQRFYLGFSENNWAAEKRVLWCWTAGTLGGSQRLLMNSTTVSDVSDQKWENVADEDNYLNMLYKILSGIN